MFDKLQSIELQFVELEDALAQGELPGSELVRVTKERSKLEGIVTAFRQYKKLQSELEDARALLSGESADADDEMRALAKEEVDSIGPQMKDLERELTVMMLPSDARDDRDVILEIRAGTGGEEAGLFASDLMRMYMRYAENQRWKVEVLGMTESAKGGVKEVVLEIAGDRVFSRLKFESGVHRVQRVPETESQGRVHTSACTVAVLAEAEEVDLDINPADLRIDTYRSSGAGGQHVNTTDSAVRITHIPSGVVAECQDERSQHKNRDKAMKMLRSRILEKLEEEKNAAISADRKSQVGSGDRSERIRTYNYPQGRVTDHRINLTLYKLDQVIQGDLDEIFDSLGSHFTAEQLKQHGVGDV